MVPPLSAQPAKGPSIFTLLPPAGSLEIGSETPGTFAPSDFLSEGRRVRAYTFEGRRGSPVTVDLISEDFDAYLYLLGPEGAELGNDDDSGGACHARLSLVLPAEGRYTIVAGAWRNGTGAFRISLADRARAPSEERCDGGAMEDELLAFFATLEPEGEIGVGEQVKGSLADDDARMGDGSFVDAYRLRGATGETAVIDLISDAFDALLYVVDPSGESYASDDDAGGACNSRVRITLGTGPRLIVVNSLSSTGSGGYTLRVSGDGAPRAEGSCQGG